jgi:hypothetical protein
MSELTRRFKERQSARAELANIVSRPDQVVIIHYSCESFHEDNRDGRSPRVTSIAVRYYHSGQTESYSIQAVAEERKLSHEGIAGNYADLEKVMLVRFYEFLKTHRKYRWVHWNMRDINFGFQAIEHRFRVLGGVPESVSDDHKHDLARLMVSMYGRRYIAHPRLTRLVELNQITSSGMLEGAEEAEKFRAGEYLSVHRSTLRKVDVLANVLQRLSEGTIKTNAGYLEARGITVSTLPAIVRDHPVYMGVTIVGAVLAVVHRFTYLLAWLSD